MRLNQVVCAPHLLEPLRCVHCMCLNHFYICTAHVFAPLERIRYSLRNTEMEKLEVGAGRFCVMSDIDFRRFFCMSAKTPRKMRWWLPSEFGRSDELKYMVLVEVL